MKHNRLANVNNVGLQIKNEILQLVGVWVIGCTPLSQRVCAGGPVLRAAGLASLERLVGSL